MAFEGFTDAISEFFSKIRMNNNSVFFNEHRSEYEDNVKKPFFAFAEEIAPTILEIDPGLETRPGKVVSRIRRDTRFSRDKSPYRDHMWVGWRPASAPESKSNLPALYFGLEIDSWQVGCGYYEATPTTMRAFRQKILAAPESFLSVVNSPELTSNFTFHSEEYKKPKIPDGTDERLIPWLRSRGFYMERHQRWEESVYTPEFAAIIGKYLTALGPFYRYLSKLPVVEE